jgi:sirohydrochlorin ferrochelatase
VNTAVLLIAHGSRRAEANRDLDWLAEQLRGQGTYPHVQTSYLELTEPGIEAGGERCVAEGAQRVLMLPYFLSPGVHVREDLIEARDKLRERFPDVGFELAEPLGRHPGLVGIVRERLTELS